MMSDSEELPILHNDTISSSREENFDVFCVIPMKFPNNINFTLFNWKKLMIVAWGIQMMFFMSVVGLIKPEWELYVKISIITAVVSPLIGYMMVLLNKFNGGWGRENSKFWCHMRIMYLAGYNSIRWAISSAVDPCIIIAACLIMGENNSNSIRAAITIIYCYFILHRLEQEKSSPVEWDKFKDTYHDKIVNGYKINLRTVNCTNEDDSEVKNLLDQFNIDGFPTIKAVKNGKVYDYDAKPDSNNLKQFLDMLTN